jgi:outer membrane biosynthesis protein TonB
MRIYNGTKSTLVLPYSAGENLTIASKTPSGNVLCSNEFISMLVTSYGTEEIAIIASGPFEITACANVPTAVNYVVQSLDEAIQRFNPVVKENKTKTELPPLKKEHVTAAPKKIVEPVKDKELKKEKVEDKKESTVEEAPVTTNNEEKKED